MKNTATAAPTAPMNQPMPLNTVRMLSMEKASHKRNQRRFRVQPTHLYERTAQDRQADAAEGCYSEWRAMAHRFGRALTRRQLGQHRNPKRCPPAVESHWSAPTGRCRRYSRRGEREMTTGFAPTAAQSGG